MSAERVTELAKAAALHLMVDACIVTRRSTKVTNADTGVITQQYTTIYTGKCRVQQRTFFDRPRNIGESLVMMLAVEVQLPITATGVGTDDIITITAALKDPDLVNRVFHVRGMGHKTYSSMRKFACIEINS